MSQALQRQAHFPVVAPPAWFPTLPRRSSLTPRVGGHTVGENRAARSPPLSARRHFVLPCHPHLASAGTPLRRPHRALPHPSALRHQLCWPCVSRKKRSSRHHRRSFLPRFLRRFHPPLVPAVTPLASTAPLLSPPCPVSSTCSCTSLPRLVLAVTPLAATSPLSPAPGSAAHSEWERAAYRTKWLFASLHFLGML